MGAGKAGNFGQAGHIAVIHGQFAQYAAGLQARHAHEVNCGFGVTAPFKHATGARPQREHMAGAAQVVGLGIGSGGGLDGGHAVCRRNTRGNARGRFNGYGKGCSLGVGVVLCHHGQLKPLHMLVGEAQADNAAAMTNQHGHLRHGKMLRAENQITFVFPIFVIHNANTAALAQRGKSSAHAFFGSAKRRKGQ